MNKHCFYSFPKLNLFLPVLVDLSHTVSLVSLNVPLSDVCFSQAHGLGLEDRFWSSGFKRKVCSLPHLWFISSVARSSL